MNVKQITIPANAIGFFQEAAVYTDPESLRAFSGMELRFDAGGKCQLIATDGRALAVFDLSGVVCLGFNGEPINDCREVIPRDVVKLISQKTNTGTKLINLYFPARGGKCRVVFNRKTKGSKPETIDKEFSQNGQKFPNWKHVIEGVKQIEPISTFELTPAEDLFFADRFDLSFNPGGGQIVCNRPAHSVNVRHLSGNESIEISFSDELLSRVIKEKQKYIFEYRGSESPAVFRREREYIVIMPMAIDRKEKSPPHKYESGKV